MKHSIKYLAFVFFLFSVGLFSCNENEKGGLTPDMIQNPNTADGTIDKSGLPVMEFEETEHDFGKVVDGVKISYTFKFKNTGGSDLVISKVNTTCGCTTSMYTREPIPPGKEGRIKITFDSTNRKGPQHKTATIIANTQPSTKVLKLFAMVVKPNEF